MLLPTKSLRDVTGIDTFERAILYSLLLLRNGVIKDNNQPQDLTIFQDILTTNNGQQLILSIDVKLPYNPSTFLEEGGNFISSIQEIAQSPPNYLGANISATTPNNAFIPTEPSFVDTLEKYLAWSLTSWIILNKQNHPLNFENSGYFSFLEDANVPSLSAKVQLQYSLEIFNKELNLIAAVIPSLTHIDTNLIQFNNSVLQQSSLVGNNFLFGNTFLVGN